MEREVYIGVGANIEPAQNIASALVRLQSLVSVTGVSPFYQTAPVGGDGQPDYYNGVWRISSSLSPQVLKNEVLRPLERVLGRKRDGDRFAARPIDLDIILCGSLQMDEDGLVLPCPDIATRVFVGVPLFELAGDVGIPGLGSLARTVEGMDRSSLIPLEEFTNELLEEVNDES